MFVKKGEQKKNGTSIGKIRNNSVDERSAGNVYKCQVINILEQTGPL